MSKQMLCLSLCLPVKVKEEEEEVGGFINAEGEEVGWSFPDLSK